MRKKSSVILTVISVLLLLVAVFAGIKMVAAKNSVGGGGEYWDPDADGQQAWGTIVEADGVKYTRKQGISTLLFLGTDGGGTPARGNIGTGARSDTIILLILNDQEQSIKLLPISRDTMTEIDLYDSKGDYAFSGVMQVNMQFAFGDTARRGCFLTKRTVSELLHGIRIDSTMALQMDGIAAIVDGIGGITLTLPDDYSYIDPSYTEGAVVSLNGAQATSLVRYRDTDQTGSNDVRMQRQAELASQVFAQIKARGGSSFVNSVLDSASQYIEQDMDADLIDRLVHYSLDPQTLGFPGKTVAGELHDEFYVDDDALQALLLQVFYDRAK